MIEYKKTVFAETLGVALHWWLTWLLTLYVFRIPQNTSNRLLYVREQFISFVFLIVNQLENCHSFSKFSKGTDNVCNR